MIKLKHRVVQENKKTPDALNKIISKIFKFFQESTYRVIVKHKGVIVFVEIVEGSLRDSVFDFDRALYVLLFLELYLVIWIV